MHIIPYAKTHQPPAVSSRSLPAQGADEGVFVLVPAVVVFANNKQQKTTSERRQQKSHNAIHSSLFALLTLSISLFGARGVWVIILLRDPRKYATVDLLLCACVRPVLMSFIATPSLRIRKFVWPQIKINALSKTQKVAEKHLHISPLTTPHLRLRPRSRIFSFNLAFRPRRWACVCEIEK